ncbi:hypothetical protein ISCGN_002342 [Ixodes scapularis]
MRSSDSASAVEHSTALRKVAVFAQVSSRKQAKEATVSRATTSNLLNSRDRGTVVPNPCQAEVGIHFHHPDVSVLGRHRMTVSSAEVQASWETAKALYGKVLYILGPPAAIATYCCWDCFNIDCLYGLAFSNSDATRLE